MRDRQIHLDLFRGLAALLVLAGHLRGLLFRDPAPGAALPLGEASFFFATSLQSQAVAVFFVLSGYFIGGSVITKISGGNWSWGRYALMRLTRLWTVLVPAMALTFILDSIGVRVGNHIYYHGARDGLGYFIENLLFLQTIFVPAYGTDGPLWSLANEFWYYLLFPLVLGGLFPGTRWLPRLASLGLAGFLFWALPPLMIASGLVWLMGVGSWFLVSKTRLRKFAGSPPFFIVASVLFLWFLGHGVNGGFMKADYGVGAAFAGMIPFLAAGQEVPGWYERLASFLSEVSYTLYSIHFPILAFLFFGLGFPFEKPFTPEKAALFTVLFFSLVLFARAWWFLFEKRTGQIRLFCERRIFSKNSRG